MFKALHMLRPIYDWTDKIIMCICKLLLIGDIAITTMAVTGRYVSFVPDPAWSEQIVLTLSNDIQFSVMVTVGSYRNITQMLTYKSPCHFWITSIALEFSDK